MVWFLFSCKTTHFLTPIKIITLILSNTVIVFPIPALQKVLNRLSSKISVLLAKTVRSFFKRTTCKNIKSTLKFVWITKSTVSSFVRSPRFIFQVDNSRVSFKSSSLMFIKLLVFKYFLRSFLCEALRKSCQTKCTMRILTMKGENHVCLQLLAPTLKRYISNNILAF